MELMTQPEYQSVMLGILAMLCAALVLWSLRIRRKGAGESNSGVERVAEPKSPDGKQKADRKNLQFEDKNTTAVSMRTYCLAFSLEKPGDSRHQEIISEVVANRSEIVGDRRFLPRQPLILPRLLSAIRNNESDADDLVEIIRQDPGLTGEVLRIANSPLHRIKPEPINSVEYAVVLLGLDGLKSLACTAALQPMFQFKSNRFSEFAQIIWEQALDSSFAAQSYANKYEPDICFSASMLSLVSCISRIVLFRYVTSVYERYPDLKPSADTYIHVIEQHTNAITIEIMRDWQLGDNLVEGLSDYFSKVPVNKCNVLSRSLYYGRLAGCISILLKHEKITIEQSRSFLRLKGLQVSMVDRLLKPVLVEIANDNQEAKKLAS